jgi:hypothetical protein
MWIAGGLSIVVGLSIASWGARRRPPNWRRMGWRSIANMPGTREGIVVLGLVLILAGGITLGILGISQVLSR